MIARRREDRKLGNKKRGRDTRRRAKGRLETMEKGMKDKQN